jgi:ketosteroid isomerase-like protein
MTESTIRAFYEGCLRGDIDAVSTLLAPDVVVIEAASLPFGGRHEGIEAATTLFKTLFAGIDLSGVVIEAIIVQADRGAALLNFSFDLGPAGSSEASVCETFVVRNGQIVEIRPYYFDTAALLATMGGTSRPA